MLSKQIAKISPGHLARLFRENKGLSFTDYLRNIRLQKAAEALRNTKLPVSRVGKNVGYHDGSRFALHFRKKFGMTPIAYRKTHT
jgi:AraC-like DNA-binding protein